MGGIGGVYDRNALQEVCDLSFCMPTAIVRAFQRYLFIIEVTKLINQSINQLTNQSIIKPLHFPFECSDCLGSCYYSWWLKRLSDNFTMVSDSYRGIIPNCAI